MLVCLVSQQFFCHSQTHTDAQQFGSGFHLVQTGIGGRNAQVRVLGVLVVGVCRTGTGQGQTRILAQTRHALCTAGHHIQADEVAALGVRPVGNVAAGNEVVLECSLDGIDEDDRIP